MEVITNIWVWLKSHITDIILLWTTIIGAAEIIVKWTDSKKDDEILGKVRAVGVKIISWLTKFGFEQVKEK